MCEGAAGPQGWKNLGWQEFPDLKLRSRATEGSALRGHVINVDKSLPVGAVGVETVTSPRGPGLWSGVVRGRVHTYSDFPIGQEPP